MPWVRLKCNKHIRRAGEQQLYRAGESVEVGRQTATNWIMAGDAEDAFGEVEFELNTEYEGEFHLRIVAKPGTVDVTPFEDYVISYGQPELVGEYTCIWIPAQYTVLSVDLLHQGLIRIVQQDPAEEIWDLAAMLYSLDKLAGDVGSEQDQQKTERVVGDLRVPLYMPYVIWAKRTPETKAVVDAWMKDGSEDLRHSFLRALYSSNAMICTLPADWRYK